MSDHIKTEVVLFEDMIKMVCPVCKVELQWSMVQEEDLIRVQYLADCCTVLYRANFCQVVITSIVDGDDPPSTMCRCGHETVDHNRDTGCKITIGHHGTDGVLHVEKCSCWLYRKEG